MAKTDANGHFGDGRYSFLAEFFHPCTLRLLVLWVKTFRNGRWKNLLHALRVRSGYQLVSKHKGRDRIVKITVLLKFEQDQGFTLRPKRDMISPSSR